MSSPIMDAGLSSMSEVACRDAIKTLHPLKPEKIAQRSITERFSSIANIKSAVLNRFRIEEDGRGYFIAPNAIAAENDVLLKVGATLDMSDQFKNMLMRVTKNSVAALTMTSQSVNALLHWHEWEEEEQRDFLQRFHNSLIYNLQNELGEYTELASHLRPVHLEISPKPKVILPDTNAPEIFYGYAQTSLQSFPGAQSIWVNSHSDASFQGLFEPIDTTAHETIHTIEGMMAFFFKDLADFMPLWLQKDAALFFYQRHNNAYIPGRLGQAYAEQFNEQAAFAIGNGAKNILAKRMGLERPILLAP